MTHSMVTRNIYLRMSSSDATMNRLMSLVEETPSIKEAAYDSEDHKISIEYDQLLINFTGLLSILSAQGMNYKKGFGFKTRASWYDYLDTTARENASAPPPACCNKPPKR